MNQTQSNASLMQPNSATARSGGTRHAGFAASCISEGSHGLGTNGEFRPDAMPVVGTKLLAGHLVGRLALDGNGKLWRARPDAVHDIPKVTDGRAGIRGECRPSGFVGQSLDVGLQVHMDADYTKRCANCQHRSVLSAESTASMRADNTLLRRSNLKRLMEARRWSKADLPAKLGYGTPSYWNDLLNSPSKSFGEKAARRIEDSLGEPRGSLDNVDGPSLKRIETRESLLPLQDGEADLLMCFRLLKPEDRTEILSTVEQMVVATHGDVIAALNRLNLPSRADDARVTKVLGPANAKKERTPREVLQDKPSSPRTSTKKVVE